jgi:hypothetical protein
VIISLEQRGHLSTALEHIQELEHANHFTVQKNKKQKYVPKLALANGLVLIALLNQVQDQMPIQENKSCFI